MVIKARLPLVVTISLFYFACSGSAKITQGNDASAASYRPNSLSSASAEISASTGGYINVGKAQLRIPSQALESDTTITAELVDIALPEGGAKAIGQGIRLKPEGLQFLKPAELMLCYSAGEVADLNAQGARIFYHTEDNHYVAIAGSADTHANCVSSHIEHFSSYVAAAYTQLPGNTAPVIGGANFLPTTPLAGVPLRVRTTIDDTNGSTPIGTTVPGSVVAAFFYYRVAGSATFTKVPLQPDTTDDTVTNRYFFEIPASEVTPAGIEYYFEATDNLNVMRRLPAAAGAFSTRTVPFAATGIRFSPTGTLNISAGFSRSLTLQASYLNASNVVTWQNISADNFALTNGSLGALLRSGPSTVRLNAVGTGSGQVTSTIAAFSTATNVNVVSGLLTHIEITDMNQVVLNGTLELPTSQMYDFDVVGYDSYGNVTQVYPVLTTTGGIGTVTIDVMGAHFAPGATVAAGNIIADLAGLTDTLSISLYVPPQVTATAPSDNTPGIAVSSSIGISFSHVMDTSTLTTTTTAACLGTLQVSSDNFATCVAMTSATPVFYASNTLAVLQPAANLTGSTTHKIRVTTAARNTGGYPLAQVYTTPTGFTTVPVPPVSLIGEALWARTAEAGTTNFSLFTGVAADNSGVYAVANLSDGTYNFGSGASVNVSTWGTGVIVKYDHAGVAQWARVPVAMQRSTHYYKVAVDNAGNIYVAGIQSGNGTNNFGNGVSVTTTGITANALLLKYDSNGNALWGQVITPQSPYQSASEYRAVHVGADGNIYVGGMYSSPFPPIAANLSPSVALSAVAGSRTIVAKYDANGNAVWVRAAETGNSNYTSTITAITTDGFGAVYAAGIQGGNSIISYGGGITLTTDNGGTSSSLLLKYDAAGTILWARIAVPPGLTLTASSAFTGVKSDSAGNIYVTGNQRGIYTFDYGNGVSGAAPYFATNAVLVKYNTNGSAQWLRTATVAPLNSFFTDLVIPNDAEIYVVGYQQNSGNYSYGNSLTVAGPGAVAYNGILLRFNEQGSLLAAKTLVAASNNLSYGNITHTDSAFYLVGNQYNNTLFDFGNGVTTVTGSTSEVNPLIVKYQR